MQTTDRGAVDPVPVLRVPPRGHRWRTSGGRSASRPPHRDVLRGPRPARPVQTQLDRATPGGERAHQAPGRRPPRSAGDDPALQNDRLDPADLHPLKTAADELTYR